MKIIPVVLCGGSGTRLWPLSRKSFPKQFVPLIGNKSLLQLTLERVAFFANHAGTQAASNRLMCVASEEHRFLVADALEAASQASPTSAKTVQNTVLLEPVGRNTAAAMALAALSLQQDLAAQGEGDALMLFCPADHHIPDAKEFHACILRGVEAANNGAIVTFGVVPSFPSTAYGYIEQGETLADGSQRVLSFIEKPDEQKAQALLLKGQVLWNAGIFLVSLKTLLQALSAHAPDILASCQAAMAHTQSENGFKGANEVKIAEAPTFQRPEPVAFKACRSESIDYAVMEHFDNIAVLPFRGQWSDVGSWNAVAQLSPADEDGNRVEGHGLPIHAKNTFIFAPHRKVVALGTEDLLIVDTPDALLVTHRTQVEGVKEVVARLESAKAAQAVTHRKVARPWGWYDSVDVGERFQVKRIGVKPGASLSLQKHHHRAEHWIVVAGTAEVTRGDEVFLLSENQSTYIPIGEVHRLKNPGKVYLEMIEVQSGSYLGEDDIVRLEDTYGRTSST